MAVYRYKKHFYEYAPAPHRLLFRKWYEQHGLGHLTSFEGHYWDSETRILTAGTFQVKTMTPPPGFERSKS